MIRKEGEPGDATLSIPCPVEGDDPPGPGLQAGQLFAGRFVIGPCLGRGGYGVVYRVYDRLVRRDAALKVLRADRGDDRSRRRFRREAAVARDASSPNLVRIFDVGEQEGFTYLVMEHLPSGTLRDRLKRGPLDIEETIALARGIARGLSALHSRGLVHRDLKPGNVLFDEHGKAKVGDFGLAAWYEGDETRTLAHEALLGTAIYVSPEQAIGAEIDPRSDLFSLGVVLFEALVGRPPFRGTEPVATVLQRLSHPAPPVRRLRREVPRWLGAVVARLLERDPAARYASATEVLRDLESRRTVRTTVRRRALAAVVAITLASAAAVAAWEYQASRFARMRAHAGPARAGLPPGVASVEGLDRRGRVLWRRDGAEQVDPKLAVIARLFPEGRRLVTILQREAGSRSGFEPPGLGRDEYGFLSVLDPQTGVVVRRVDLRPYWSLPEGLADRYVVLRVSAIDVDRDGYDEVIASFGHLSSWPSFSMMWEPRLDRVRGVLMAGGFHGLAAVEDLDGDGSAELLFNGHNSRLGRYPSLVAVKLHVGIGEQPELPGSHLGVYYTPGLGRLALDAMETRSLSGPLWSRLLPRGSSSYGPEGVVLDRSRRRVQIRYSGVGVADVAFSGGSPADRVGREQAAKLRYQAFAQIEDGRRLAALGEWGSAVEASARAREAATRVGDLPLAECAARDLGRHLVGAGRAAEAEDLFDELAAGDPEAASEIAFTAAQAHHASGATDAAVRWYQRAMGPGGESTDRNRSRTFLLEGIFLALAEAGRWQDAREEIHRYAGAFPDDAPRAELYAGFARSRLGLPVGSRIVGTFHAMDSQRYIALERLWSQGAAPDEMLARIRAELGAASDTRGALRALEGMVHAGAGRDEAAVAAASEGVRELESLLPASLVARALVPLARERLAVLEAGPSSARSVSR